jgi:transcriptional regulator with XRE-family HTH domain
MYPVVKPISIGRSGATDNAPTLPGMPRPKAARSDFGSRLISIRRQRDMTQYDLADIISVSQRTISYYESGTGHPHAAMLAKLAAALKVTTDDLLGTTTAREPLPTDNPEARRLWKQFRILLDLPDKDRRAVLHMLNSLSQVRSRTREPSHA